MGSIHKNLIFDHLYFVANAEEFEELKKIFLRFECASHSITKADDDSWEGIYIQTRGQHYLEILKDRRTNGLGFCQRAFSPMSQSARDIMNDFPDLPWKTFERKLDGQKWFTALSCDNYLDLTTLFNSWVMHYYQRDIQKTFTLKKYELSRLCHVQMSANPNLIEKIKLNSTWFNARTEFSNSEAIFHIQTFYSDACELKITFDNQDEGFEFKKAEFEISKGFATEDTTLKHYKLKTAHDRLILEKI